MVKLMEQIQENLYKIKAFHEDFIGIYDEVLSKEECQKIIEEIDLHMSKGSSVVKDGKDQFPTNENGRKDSQIFANKMFGDVENRINKFLDVCVNAYANEFFVLKNIKSIKSEAVKLQKTPPRGGYHVWHCEADSKYNSDRILVWTMYLNDIPDGEGETEFLWQGVRVKPKAGTVCIFPAAFTHTHRGNPVYSCDKYIATGWYCFNE
jgi:hypothetical protein